MLNDCVCPIQLFSMGVTLIPAVSGVAVLAAVKLISPLPLAANPMAVLSFDQLNVGLTVPEKLRLTAVPAQVVRLPGAISVGVGLMVMLKFCGVPKHPFNAGVTVILPVCGAPTAAALKLILPVPEAANPMAVLLFVQPNVVPIAGLPLKVMPRALPGQAVRFPGCTTLGTGCTLRVKLSGAPTQVPIAGVTLMVAVSVAGTIAAVKFKFPLPLAGKPIVGLLFVQVKVAPGVPAKFRVNACPLHAFCVAIGFTTGVLATVMVKVCAGPVQVPPDGLTVIVAVSLPATTGLV